MIALKSVSRTFGAVQALCSVSLRIAPGETMFLKGPSGSGKTTLLRLIAGLEEPDAGTIELGGKLVGRPGWILAPHLRDVGVVFQQQVLWPHMTVSQNVEFPIAHWPGWKRHRRVAELLDLTGLGACAKRRPGEVSGGEGRRTAIARALAAPHKRLLLDEPLIYLDPEWKGRMADLILREASAAGASVLWVAHDEDEMAVSGVRVATLRAGCLAGAPPH